MKNLNSESSSGVSDNNTPWMGRGTTYPASYILTGAPPPLPSSNVYKPHIDCPPSQAWRVPDPYDCSIFHDCYHGTNLVSYCPAQLYYNPEKQGCDYASSVSCKYKSILFRNINELKTKKKKSDLFILIR